MENLVRKTTSGDEKLAKAIVKQLKRDSSMTLLIDKKPVKLSGGYVKLLNQIFSMMANGRSLVVVSSEKEISTQEAAKILNISRPYVVQLLEMDEIPFRKVGKHRRMLLKDVLRYKKFFDRQREKAATFLIRQAQELKWGYE